MNKLIITGNGFDLAHKLPTSYADFINWFWNNICKNFENELFSNLYYFNPEFRSKFEHIEFLNNSLEIISELKKDDINKEITVGYNDSTLLKIGEEYLCKYDNLFFKYINDSLETNTNWVDIEMCYYKLLTDSLLRARNNISSLKDLNNQFEQVKKLFEYYLKEVVSPLINSNLIKLEIIQYLRPVINDGYSSKFYYNEYLKEFAPFYHSLLEEDNKCILERKIINETDSNLPKLLFLDFNYTGTVLSYKNALEYSGHPYSNVEIIKIHGEIGNKSNPINFGFGDEMDTQYKVLENYNDNEYLKNIKSFHYFYNQNYRDLMNWIELGNYQIIIMGHSCGLSDRTLLNTLFEHKNCASIKFFYYENDKGDNYTDIIQNISRHFDDKKAMRNKIVNKSLTNPLPQK